MIKKHMDIVLKDGVELLEKSSSEMNIKSTMYEEIKTPTGKTLFKKVGENASLIGGTNIVANFLAGINNKNLIKIKTLDSDEYLNLSSTVESSGLKELFGLLFMTDGAVEGTVYPVKRNSKGRDFSTPNNVIPMRMMPEAEDDVINIMKKYELRSINDGYVKYFVKKPESISVLHLTKSGVALTDYPDAQTIDEDIVTVMIIKVEISEDDMDVGTKEQYIRDKRDTIHLFII